MRLILFIIFICSYSEAYFCPSYIQTHQEAKKAHQWLSRFKESQSLHGCKVEIIACEPGGEFNDTAPIGEILIETSDGREAYLNIDFPSEESTRLNTKVKTSGRAFHFQKTDRFYEETHGRTEVWRFEMRTLWNDPTRLNVLELGIYTTHSQLGQPNGNDSHWFVCAP